MDTSIVYTKTAKGVLELKNGARVLSVTQGATLQRVDGRSTVASLCETLSAHGRQVFEDALASLEMLGCIKVFTRSAPAPVAAVSDDSVTAPDGHPPPLQIEELSAEEGVRAWAEARRGTQQLVQQGFYATAHIDPDGNILHRHEILIVEDEEAIATLMTAYLTRRGFSVRCVGDGLQALQILEEKPVPQLVLLDVNLPQINGFDILAFMRAHAQLKQVPAIMVTAQVSDADVLRGLKGEADGYIFKPFEWSVLLSCIHRVLGIATTSAG